MKHIKYLPLLAVIVAAVPVRAQEVHGFKTFGRADETAHGLHGILLESRGISCPAPRLNYWLNSQEYTYQTDISRSIMACGNGRAYILNIDENNDTTIFRIK